MVEHIVSKKLNIEEIKVDRSFLCDMLGEIMLLEDDWLAMHYDDVTTETVFCKGWFQTVLTQFLNPEVLKFNIANRNAEIAVHKQLKADREQAQQAEVQEQIDSRKRDPAPEVDEAKSDKTEKSTPAKSPKRVRFAPVDAFTQTDELQLGTVLKPDEHAHWC